MQEGEKEPSTMHEMMIGVWKDSIQYGIEYTQFCDLSLKEIEIITGAKKKMIEDQYKSTIVTNFELAQNIAVFVSMTLNGKEMPTLQQIYPELFNEQPQALESAPVISEEEQREKSWRFYKEQMLDFANQHNAIRAKRLEEGVNSN